VKWWNGANVEERKMISGVIGLVGSRESVEWLWDHHFAAVAGDSPAFEAWPPEAAYSMPPYSYTFLFILSS